MAHEIVHCSSKSTIGARLNSPLTRLPSIRRFAPLFDEPGTKTAFSPLLTGLLSSATTLPASSSLPNALPTPSLPPSPPLRPMSPPPSPTVAPSFEGNVSGELPPVAAHESTYETPLLENAAPLMDGENPPLGRADRPPESPQAAARSRQFRSRNLCVDARGIRRRRRRRTPNPTRKSFLGQDEPNTD
ncbi:hypothetical protein ACSQ67_014468 [Phaseolus vulgaris]